MREHHKSFVDLIRGWCQKKGKTIASTRIESQIRRSSLRELPRKTWFQAIVVGLFILILCIPYLPRDEYRGTFSSLGIRENQKPMRYDLETGLSDYDSNYDISKKVKIGDQVYINLKISHNAQYGSDVKVDLWVNASYTFVKGKDIVGKVNAWNSSEMKHILIPSDNISDWTWSGSYAGREFEMVLQDFKSTGIIVLSFSYGGFYFEGDTKKTFGGEASVHKVRIEIT